MRKRGMAQERARASNSDAKGATAWKGVSKKITKSDRKRIISNVKVRENAARKELQPRKIVLSESIPDVVRWVRERMDAEVEETEEAHGLLRNQNTKSFYNARSFAQKIVKQYDVRILMNGSKYWKGETRMWENVCALSAKLPGEGRGRNIFDAMSRYPSSMIVYSGLKLLYGRNMVVGDRRVHRFSLPENAIALFSPGRSDGTIAKKWFEDNTLARMQELVIHMCAISEYILRCAYQAKEASACAGDEASCFLSFVESRIKVDQDCKNRKVLRFDSWDPMAELSSDCLASCLEKSLGVAHGAVIDGTKKACRKYGRKEGNGRSRVKIQLWMLKRPLPDVMDALINRLETVLRDILGDTIDFDMFRVYAMRHLRSVDSIFTEVGSVWCSHELDFRPPLERPKNTEALVSTRPYIYGLSGVV
ncbi:hypothetical protein BWQ96_10741 [Gracilariopsis chorda]|uniref:Uncharacterized protein n=1 Tax=Gracilariopsis chorda TaxID=448386 RepID=A0A2V3IBY7_9FLOR|nr:hypothetical protein BWQ96_10741 [Gracilariopsis chorda]|eukprot:PXF39558.1 hypothetical protein BWQ96_10741 [Gracilariopsis chorda]